MPNMSGKGNGCNANVVVWMCISLVVGIKTQSPVSINVWIFSSPNILKALVVPSISEAGHNTSTAAHMRWDQAQGRLDWSSLVATSVVVADLPHCGEAIASGCQVWGGAALGYSCHGAVLGDGAAMR